MAAELLVASIAEWLTDASAAGSVQLYRIVLEAEVLLGNISGAASAGERSVLVRAIGATELARGELAVANFVNKIIRSLAEEVIVQWPSTWTNGPFNVQNGRVQLIEIERD